MGNAGKKLEDMDVIDNFLIGQLASDKVFGVDFCRRIVSTLLHRKIGRLRVVSQKEIPALAPELRGIRMDVEVEEYGAVKAGEEPVTMNIYDIEPHLRNDIDLARHNRFFQARIDSRGLESGAKDFSKLPNLYVLTILNFDPFGHDHMMYTVKNRCMEVPDLEYEDGLCFCYFYTNGTKGGNRELQTMLRYLQDSREENAADSATREIHDYVCKVKMRPEVKQAYMRLEEFIYYERKEAAEKAALEAVRTTIVQNILMLLERRGTVPETVRKRVEEENEPEILNRWLALAADAGSMDEFAARMDQTQRALNGGICGGRKGIA